MNKNTVAFTLLCYNQEDVIADAVDGVLAQSSPADEIIISDDASGDASSEIIREKFAARSSSGRILFTVNERNIGCSANRWKVLNQVHSQYVVTADGDDISLPNRIAVYRKVLEDIPDAVCVMTAFNQSYVDSASTAFFCPLQETILFCGCSALYRKDLFTEFGEFSSSVIDDLLLAFRALLKGKIVLVDTPTVLKREPRDPLAVMKKIYAREGLVIATVEKMRQELQVYSSEMPSAAIDFFNSVFAHHLNGASSPEYIAKWDRYKKIIDLYSLPSWRIIDKVSLSVKIARNMKEAVKLFFLSFAFVRIMNSKRASRSARKVNFTNKVRIVEWNDVYSGRVSWPFFQIR